MVSAAEGLAQKLNKEIEKGNATGAFMIAILLATFKDILDIYLNALNITFVGVLSGVEFVVSLFLTSFLFFFMLSKGWFLKTRIKIWYWILSIFFEGLPGFSLLPISTLLVLYAWRLAKKRKANAEIKLENLDNLTAQEINSLNNDIGSLEDGVVNRDTYKYRGQYQINNTTENRTSPSRTDRTTQYQNSMNNVLDLQKKTTQIQQERSPDKNSIAEGGPLIGSDIPTYSDKIYRQIQGPGALGALEDIDESGYVRSSITASKDREIPNPRGHGNPHVYWTRGKEGKMHSVPRDGYVLEAPHEVAQQGLVRKEDLTAIHKKEADGKISNILGNPGGIKTEIARNKSIEQGQASEKRVQSIITSNIAQHHQEFVQDVRQSKLDWIQSEAFAQRLQTWGATLEGIKKLKEQLTQNALDGNAYILPPDKFKQVVDILQKTTGEKNIKDASAFHDSVNHSVFLQERMIPPIPPILGQDVTQPAATPKVDITELNHEYGHLVAGDIWDKPFFRNWKPRFKAGAPDSSYIGMIHETDTRIRSMFRDVREFFDPNSDKFDLKHLMIVKKLRGQGQVSKDTKDLLEHYDDDFLIELANTMPAI